MSNVKSYTDEQLIERVESLPSFKGWKKGKYLFCLRSNEDEFNKFDDKGYPFEVKIEGQRPINNGVFPITTNAGKVGLKGFEQWNSKGCAILVADHIQYESHVFGQHKGKDGYIQTFKGEQYPYTRDNDKDELSENFGKVYTDRIGANIHRAGTNSENIDSWSVGCIVFKRLADYMKFLTFANKLPMNTCILNEF